MKKQLLGGGVDPKCLYCRFGTQVADSDTVLCVKHGVRDKDEKCRKYRYDPLKREPRRPAALPSFAENDFTLELED